MKFVKALVFLGAIAAAVALIMKVLDDSADDSVGTPSPNKFVPVIEETLQKHAGEESPIVQAFAEAVEDAKKS